MNTLNRVLFIGLVWPEPTSSAAGYRILQLVDLFIKKGYEVVFASAAQKSERSFKFSSDVKTVEILLNNDSFDDFITELNPTVVVYDRFMIEEQYGWRVRNCCPEALTILDTEDLHFLRKAREIAFKKNAVLNLFTDDTKRELASIYRCDFSLIISKNEMTLLRETFNVNDYKILYLPFVFSEEDSDAITNDFAFRSDFCFIGNFIHEPNYQTVVQLKKTYWPILRKKLPEAKLYIYGAYPSQKIWDLHNEKEGFIVVGAVDSVKEVFNKHKVLLAPIPFGAGIKGKFFDAAKYNIPNVTTNIGAEAMFLDKWNGFVEDDVDEFIKQAVLMYTNEVVWNDKVTNGKFLLSELYTESNNFDILFDKINSIQKNIWLHRNSNFIGEVLFQQQLQASKFLSLWIMEKNK